VKEERRRMENRNEKTRRKKKLKETIKGKQRGGKRVVVRWLN